MINIMATRVAGEGNQTLLRQQKLMIWISFIVKQDTEMRPSILIHGFPTSSHMFRNLIMRLSDKFRLIAPDYPGFGNS